MAGRGPRELRVAMPRGAVRWFSAAMVDRFRRLHPRIRLQIFERESAQNRASVLAGEAELALLYGALPSPELEQVPLLSERILVVGSSGAGGNRTRPSYSIEELAELPLILPGNPHGYRRVVEGLHASRGLKPNILFEVNGFATSLNMVQEGLGFAISTFAPVEERLRAGLLTVAPIEGGNSDVELFMAWRRGAEMSRGLRDLIATIRAIAAGIEPSFYCRPVAGPEPAATAPVPAG